MPEVAVLMPYVELKFCPSPMMERERPIIGRRMSAEDLFTGPALQSFQLRANLLKLSDAMLWRECVELVCDRTNVDRHGLCLSLPHVDDAGRSRRTR